MQQTANCLEEVDGGRRSMDSRVLSLDLLDWVGLVGSCSLPLPPVACQSEQACLAVLIVCPAGMTCIQSIQSTNHIGSSPITITQRKVNKRAKSSLRSRGEWAREPLRCRQPPLARTFGDRCLVHSNAEFSILSAQGRRTPNGN